jgi:hypothetical protein
MNACAVIVFVLFAGCNHDNRFEIHGFVCTKSGLLQSFMRVGVHDEDNRYVPIAGAAVFLSSSDDKKDVIDKFSCITDESGSYSFKGVLPADKKTVFIIVEGPGFETLHDQIDVGPLGRFMKNTIVLKAMK